MIPLTPRPKAISQSRACLMRHGNSFWKAFTDPEHMKHWWGPKGFTVRITKMDFRPGGTYHYCMRSPDGRDMWGKFVYREIVAPERIVFINSFSDENGGLTRHPMSPTW